MSQAPPLENVSRIANRVKRHAIARVAPVRRVAQSQYERRLRRYSSVLPSLGAADRALVDRLHTDGVHISTFDSFGVPGTDDVRTELERLRDLIATEPAAGRSTVRPARDELLKDVALWRWGLDERMLDIAENYLGQPARYYGADVRREVADGRPAHDVQNWHRDIEDHRVLKILVWLNDVDADGGPFAYIPLAHSRRAVDHHRYVSGFVSDEQMRPVVPEDEWQLCTGPAWTAVMPDTAQLFHRATPPESHDRYSVTFTWSSRHPIKTIWQAPYTPDQVDAIRAGLNTRQLACLPKAFER